MSRYTLAWLATVLALMILVAWYWFSGSETVSEKENSIAVLPFSILTQEQDIAFFAEGLAQEIIHQLTPVSNFRIIARSSSFAYGDQSVALSEIGAKLNVNYLIQGSVSRESELMKVSIKFIDVVEDKILWSQNFTANIETAFMIQQEISEKVVLSLTGEREYIAKSPANYIPKNGEAFLHVLRGRQYNQNLTQASLKMARDEFLMATLLEPEYADAYVDLSISYLLMAQNRILTVEESSKLASKAIDKALTINPQLAKAHAARGILAYNDARQRDAKAAFEKALALDDSLYIALINYANLLRSIYSTQESLEYYERALSVAPLSSAAHWGIGNTLIGMGRLDEAISRYETCVYRLPSDKSCNLGLAYAQRLLNQHQAANETLNTLSSLELEKDYYYRLALAWHYLWTGRIEQANEIYQSLVAQFGMNIDGLQSITFMNIRVGKLEQWQSQLSQAYENNPNNVAMASNVATSLFYLNNCEQATPILEGILKHFGRFFRSAENLANGETYFAMLGYCYAQLDMDEAKLQTLQEYKAFLDSLPSNNQAVPGFVFANALYFALNNETTLAENALTELNKSEWHLKWLINENPILKDMRINQ